MLVLQPPAAARPPGVRRPTDSSCATRDRFFLVRARRRSALRREATAPRLLAADRGGLRSSEVQGAEARAGVLCGAGACCGRLQPRSTTARQPTPGPADSSTLTSPMAAPAAPHRARWLRPVPATRAISSGRPCDAGAAAAAGVPTLTDAARGAAASATTSTARLATATPAAATARSCGVVSRAAVAGTSEQPAPAAGRAAVPGHPNGVGTMAGYAERLTPRDGWAIVAYMRALQLSQHAAADARRMRPERQRLDARARSASDDGSTPRVLDRWHAGRPVARHRPAACCLVGLGALPPAPSIARLAVAFTIWLGLPLGRLAAACCTPPAAHWGQALRRHAVGAARARMPACCCCSCRCCAACGAVSVGRGRGLSPAIRMRTRRRS